MTDERREYLTATLARLKETESMLLEGLMAPEEEVERELGITHVDILGELSRVGRLILEINELLGADDE
jgi:hypothetical protein|tara:strand:+ start:433 stop:639 length:207 start_codon:yes stop_codon:yes gene_type:complete